MPHYPFHFSFFISSISSARKFYGEVLGCREGRSTDTWVDFDFYGNQLSMHVSNDVPESKLRGVVDTIVVPIPHFGCILPWDEFHDMAEKLKAAGTEFIITPTIRFAEDPGMQATMFFRDGCGNSLEIKSFKNPEHIFTPNNPMDKPLGK